MKKLLGLVFGLMVSISSAMAADTICNLYNKANGVLYGYPSASHTWVDTNNSPNREISIGLMLQEGKQYTMKRVAGNGADLRIHAASDTNLTAGQSLTDIYTTNAGVNQYTFTVPSGTPYVIFYARNTYPDKSTLTVDDVINGFMVVEGSTAPSEYIPYDASCGLCPSGQVLQTYTSATGTVTQNGTPTPDAPVYPTFYTQGNMTLRKVGDYADSYDATTGKITRRVGYKVLNGTEDWVYNNSRFVVDITDYLVGSSITALILSHYSVPSASAGSIENGYARFGKPTSSDTVSSSNRLMVHDDN